MLAPAVAANCQLAVAVVQIIDERKPGKRLALGLEVVSSGEAAIDRSERGAVFVVDGNIQAAEMPVPEVPALVNI
jgi:hypothetical protein